MNAFAMVGAILFLVGVGQMMLHLRTWRRACRQDLEAKEHEYRRRQFRRRIQSSGMLAALGVAILVGQRVAGPPWAFLAYWGGVLLLVIWMMLLAVADIIATKYYYGGMRHHYMIEEVKLQAELRRLQDARRNGRGNGKAAKGYGPETGGKQSDANSGH